MGREVPLRCSVWIHRKLLRPFSDSFGRGILGSSRLQAPPPRPYTKWDGVEPHLALYHAPNCYVYC